MKKQQLLYFLFLVLMYSCVSTKEEEKQVKDTVDSIKVNTIEKRLVEEKINEEVALKEENKDSVKEIENLKESLDNVTSYVYTIFPNDTESKYASIPFILQNKTTNFTVDEYPDLLTLRLVPSSKDTLEVITGSSDCSSCLEMLKIQTKKGKELYYKITQYNETIIEKGEIDSVLKGRNVSELDLKNDNYIYSEYDNWKNYAELSKNINQQYILATDLNWYENLSIQEINTKVKNQSNTSLSLDSLKTIYENNIAPSQHIIFDNLLSEEKQRYFHSGGFSKEINTNIHLLIESLNIIYISSKNDVYVVEWLKDYKEVLDDVGAPFDDNYVEKKNGIYKINKWDDNSMIGLFHPNMLYGDYIVVYEIKLKNRNVYIQSPLDIVSYR